MARMYEEKITITITKLIKNKDADKPVDRLFIDGTNQDFEDEDPDLPKAEAFNQLQSVIEETITTLLEDESVVIETTLLGR